MPSWLKQHNNTIDDVSTAHSIKSSALRKPGERKITQKFELEISVIICRDISGKISAYDPSENIHKNGILVESKVPANISFSTSNDAIILASKIVRNLNYVGVMGIEFFITKAKKILVNEMAPRVHNSGHWTQTGCISSQFEQHIRSISGVS